MSYKSSYNPYTYFRFNWEIVLTLTLKKCKYTTGLMTVGRLRPHWCIFSFKARMKLILMIIVTANARSATSAAETVGVARTTAANAAL